MTVCSWLAILALFRAAGGSSPLGFLWAALSAHTTSLWTHLGNIASDESSVHVAEAFLSRIFRHGIGPSRTNSHPVGARVYNWAIAAELQPPYIWMLDRGRPSPWS